MSARSTVGELRPLGELAGDEQKLDCLAHLAFLGARPGLAGESANLELGGAGGADVARGQRRRARPPPACRCASVSASARASSASIRPRRSVETPLPRNAGSTPSCAASQAIDSAVGRVLPRSIWLMYSFENRSPATWVCVSPAARRSERSRSPIRDAGAAGVVAVGDFAADVSTSLSTGEWVAASIWCSVKAIHVSAALLIKGEMRCSTVGFAGEVQRIANHLTELLDFFGHGTYSPDYQAPQPDARLWSAGHTSRIGGSKKESRAWAAESRASAVTPSRSPSLKRPRKPQPGAFLFSGPVPTDGRAL